jgi:Predicted nucleic acid-binding protein, contains PIN domain
MNALVVDASVVMKWFIPEVGSPAARELLAEDHAFYAPDFLFAEAGNVIWKKVGRGEVSANEATDLIADICRLPIHAISVCSLAADALQVAIATGLTVYDALYLVLAVQLKSHLITADQRFFCSIAATPALVHHVRLLETDA